LAKFFSGTAVIRPVSDERGFEVVGHFQYGRRIYLKDGRLITNDVQNPRAKVDLPLALAGGLSEMLTAQSQGLVAVTTGYTDPALALTTLEPEDRQTAAFINPDTKEPTFVDVGDNFVDTAPLGSQEKQGAASSVEASQLSRALTLAEMSVKDSQTRNDEDCVCLTGRQDLAFINSGYQVKTLTGTATEDLSVLTTLEAGGGPINSGATQGATTAVDQTQAALTASQQKLSDLEKAAIDNPGNAAKQQAVQDQLKVVDQAQTAHDTANETLDNLRTKYQTTESVFTQTTSELISKVDQFLVNLYTALDTPHEQLEQALRGDLLPGQAADTSGLNADQISPPSELSPPFSAPNRFMLGDPKATIGAAKTDTANISKAWSDFGQKLKSNTTKASLSKQISQDQASVSRLTSTRQQLVNQQNTHTTVIGPDLQKAIAKIDQEIARLNKNISDNQLKLGTTP
jgi:predicted  nucleic acid-binding Zn-ribbon protein